MRLPPLPDLDWTSGAPQSRDRDDVYFSGDGLSEKRVVFLEGCGLPGAWAGRERFCVGELGFGTGLNLLALMELWRRERPAGGRLDYLSFEGMLMSREQAARAHAAWPELAAFSRELLGRWPERARGVQRIALPDGVTLTLCVDDVAASLPQARAQVDAWFLDGFAPAKNAEMWSADVLAHVARLSAPGARASTYTVAGDVRRGLEAVGFAVEKRPGHGRKKERLEARFSSAGATGAAAPKRVAIVGAGIAGACAARAFLARGCDVTVFDRGAALGAGASGNPLALVMPRLDAADGPAARALLEAWLLARRYYPALGGEAAQVLEAMHRPRGDAERQRFAKLLADPPVDETILQALDVEQPGAGVRHLGAVAVKPSVALLRLLDGAELRFGVDVKSVGEIDADLVVVCAGMGLARMAGVAAPPLTGRMGQLESTVSHGSPGAIADGGYVVEAFGEMVFGATFEAGDDPRVTETAREHNLRTLERLLPGIYPEELTSRAAVRATTQDRLPFAGPPPDKDGPENEKAPDGTPAPSRTYRLIGGLGSRGFLWAPLLAEIVASEAFGEPSPVETSVAECLDPGRFLRRARRRGGG